MGALPACPPPMPVSDYDGFTRASGPAQREASKRVGVLLGEDFPGPNYRRDARHLPCNLHRVLGLTSREGQEKTEPRCANSYEEAPPNRPVVEDVTAWLLRRHEEPSEFGFLQPEPCPHGEYPHNAAGDQQASHCVPA
jgi:hypothetical protein